MSNNTLWHLTASIEEILDINLSDTRNRNKFRREVLERLDSLEAKLLQAIKEKSAEPEGVHVHLSTSTLGRAGNRVLGWLVTAAPFIAYEIIKLFLHK